ncbi:hypothetical protein EAH77_17280 [Ewingella americana]|uniref:Uncharacterized protein n=1 Tax=Ewingella americana TaxID=41202 RepID=A0A502GBM9_9GAMM|nr:hypothetical protein EAH77_17280 [Ewingella americana]
MIITFRLVTRHTLILLSRHVPTAGGDLFALELDKKQGEKARLIALRQFIDRIKGATKKCLSIMPVT